MIRLTERQAEMLLYALDCAGGNIINDYGVKSGVEIGKLRDLLRPGGPATTGDVSLVFRDENPAEGGPGPDIPVLIETQGDFNFDVTFGGFGTAAMMPDARSNPCFYAEYYEGRLVLRVWADINQEDPTHRIDLSGARLEKYDAVRVNKTPFTHEYGEPG